MGVYIKGMEMPTCCCVCPCFNDEYCYCQAADKDLGSIPIDHRHPDCPLVPVPEHGRLIDADALKARVQKLQERLWDKLTDADVGIVTADDVRFRIAEESEDFIEDAPTIIPADPAEEGEG